jgi:hypothetical protein
MPKKAAKIAREQRLPGTEDPKIEALHNAALDYAEIRDKRQELTTEEVALKKKLLAIMKSHNKQTYNYKGVSVRVVHEDETVKVRIKKDDED